MKKIFLIILISLTLTPLISKAQDYTLIEPLPCIADTGNNCSPGETIKKISLNTYIDYVFKFSIALAAFLAVVMIIFGGFQYMTSEVPGIKSDGKDKIKNAIFGLIMILASYLILQTIDPRLVEVTTEIAPIKVDTSSLEGFRDLLSNSFANLSAESLRQRETIVNKNLEYESRIKQLEDQRDKYGEFLTAEENVELQTLKQKLREGVVEKDKIEAKAGGQVFFTNIINTYRKPKITDTDTENVESNILALKNLYDEKVRLVKISNPTEAERLLKEKNYYVRLIEEEKGINETIRDTEFRLSSIVSLTPVGSVAAEKVRVEANKVFLKSKLEEYKNNLEHPEPAVAAGVPLEQYKQIMNARISSINKVLGTK